MELFSITPDYELEINKPFILLVPEFAEILKKDKGSPGDYRGDKKLMARKKLAFVYFVADFNSPLRTWEDEEKEKEALIYTNLTQSDIDDDLKAAVKKYAELMIKSSRMLRTLSNVYKGLSALDDYMGTLNFNAVDKMGRLKNSPIDFTKNIKLISEAYENVSALEKKVEAELKPVANIRGSAVLGDKEMGAGKQKQWSEEDIAKGSDKTKSKIDYMPNYKDIGKEINNTIAIMDNYNKDLNKSKNAISLDDIFEEEIEDDNE